MNIVLVPAPSICYFPLPPSSPDNEVNHSNLRSRHLLVQLHLLPIFLLPPKTPNFTPLRSFNNNNNKTLISVNPKSSFRIRASAASDNSQPLWWANLLPAQALRSDKVLRLISGATASPIGQYVSEPVTFLHSLDPIVKLVFDCLSFGDRIWFVGFGYCRFVWLLALVVLPARSHIILRFGLVVYLAILSIWVLPRHAWMDQLGRVSLISGLLFIMLGLGVDGAPALVQLRTPPPAITGLSNLPASLAGYSYLIFKLGPIQFTRKGLSVASTAACLTFTVFQSASLCQTTTTPEELAFALRWFMLPLTNLGVPVAEVILTLMLSLRFISLVFDEVRNVALGIVSRRIDWQQLTMVETIDGKASIAFVWEVIVHFFFLLVLFFSILAIKIKSELGFSKPE
ncbi:putative ABC/ECF transporter, transmembrane component [Rosa chinensis]|uniref:Putative ABC/ECF transporter, transmembrane component n=1 Tax=Rosa chinensis TaxID=74649 RepID=A0A2P6RID2_ROSCH|nr:putative ABC/ECF transporter, transmembrane component [Rosa chinensis]